MCGRYLVISNPEAIRRLFAYKEQPNFPPRYNIAPTQPVAIVRLIEGERHFALVRWGLIPAWVKDPNRFALLINARGDSINEKAAFRNAMKRRRCLFPADGFYEWKQDGPRKRAYCIRPRNGRPIAFAGIWETWTGPNGEELETAAIATTQANATLAPIHHRMPVILPPKAFEAWLDGDEVDARAAATLLTPAPDALLVAHPVLAAVNRVANDTPDLIAAVADDAPLAAAAAKGAAPSAKRRRTKRANDDQRSLF